VTIVPWTCRHRNPEGLQIAKKSMKRLIRYITVYITVAVTNSRSILWSSRARGFTLVEMLIVLGVIALLLSLLMPVMAKARASASQVACASNLRQWGQAAANFMSVNNGNLPRRGQGVQPTNQVTRPQDWFNALPPLIQMKPYVDLVSANQIARPDSGNSLWVCPAAADMPGKYYWSYGMNMGLSVETGSENNGKPDSIATVGDTSSMVLFADAPGNYCSVFPSKFPGGFNPVPRHNGSVNICFVDGHVAAVPGSYMGVGSGLIEHPDVRWHPPNSTWNGAQ
jgi:prepilin-type processing-associated H-X9-DG protein/prepilin-type N-terminal cleavage/methylation domain-containing protein